jgi:hypothetical protein
MDPDRIAPGHTWLGHIPFAFYIILLCKPKILVELGTYSGNSYFAFCQAVKRLNTHTKCFAVDTWQGDKHSGSHYWSQAYADVKQHNQTHYAEFSTLIRSTFDEAQDKFGDRSIDLLHIDGLHTYEAVKHDFESWLPKLSDNAVVLFHDVSEKIKDFGVWKLWEEIENQYPSTLFQHSHGLGVLAVGINPPAALLDFLNVENTQAQVTKKCIEKIGMSIYLREHANAQQDEILELKNQLANRDAALNGIYTSLSWKILSPLRFLKRQTIKLQQLLQRR